MPRIGSPTKAAACTGSAGRSSSTPVWHERLTEIAGDSAPEDLLLAEIEAMRPDGQIRDPRQLELFGTLLTELQGMKNKAVEVHRVSTALGATYVGTWE